jgi:hypothetical protein
VGRDKRHPPSDWEGNNPVRVPGSPDPGVYVDVHGTVGEDIWVWHWHMPRGKDNEDARWQAATVRDHTVVSVDPLTLDPSLGCDEGCPSHGFIRNGHWTNA